eukprot:4107776-Pyramimonas_sp.AAC.1
MQKRSQGFDLKGAMLVYNFYQTFFNSYCIYLFVTAHREQGLKVWGNSPDLSAKSWGISQVWSYFPAQPFNSREKQFYRNIRCTFLRFNALLLRLDTYDPCYPGAPIP